MPPPMTLATMIPAASNGPSLRSSAGPSAGDTGACCAREEDEETMQVKKTAEGYRTSSCRCTSMLPISTHWEPVYFAKMRARTSRN